MAPYARPDGRVEVNEDGIPDDPVQAAREPGEVRVLCLGDSITAGLTLPTGEARWTYVLQTELQALHPERRLRVINAGIEGYQITQMRLLLDDVGPRYRPDIVVVMFQDPGHNIYVPPDPALKWRYRVHDWLLSSWFVQTGLLYFTGYESFGGWEGEVRPLPAPDSAAAIAANLASFTQYATAFNAHMLFAAAPQADPSLAGAQPALPAHIHEALHNVAETSGIALWLPESGPTLVGLGPLAFGEGDARHLSVAGNTAVGKDIAAEIERRGWVADQADGSRRE